MKKKRPENVRVSIMIPEELYVAIKGLAKQDMRTISSEVVMILTAALTEPEEIEEEPEPPEQIGFKYEPDVEVEEE